MTGWDALDAELARWAETGRRCPVWLRDDDAVAATPALDRFLDLCRSARVMPGLAVIPAHAAPSLAEPLMRHPEAAVLVHGWAHTDHAPAGEKKTEFGPNRSAQARRDDAARGLERLNGLFSGRVLPLFVPPWNRMGADMPGLLASAGFRAASGFGRRPDAPPGPAPGLRWLNTQVDLIDWRGSRSAVETDALLDGLRRQLADRRERYGAPVEPSAIEPIGMLTHHLVHDAAVWRLLEALLDRLAGHPALDWPAVATMIGEPVPVS